MQRLLIDLPAKPMAWERRRAEAMPTARIALAVAMRVVLALAVVAVVLIVATVMAAWWILWAVVWFGLRGRCSSTARLGARWPWDRAPWARGVQRGRLAGLR